MSSENAYSGLTEQLTAKANRYKTPLKAGKIALAGLIAAGTIQAAVDLKDGRRTPINANPISWVATPIEGNVRFLEPASHPAYANTAPMPIQSPAQQQEFDRSLEESPQAQAQANLQMGDITSPQPPK